MLVIREAQMKALRQYAQDSWRWRLQRHLQQVWPAEFPEDDQGPAAVHSFMETYVPRAESYGLRSERAITRFCDLTLQLGRDFEMHTHPWARDFLDDEELTEDLKLTCLQDYLADTTTKEA